MNPWLELFGLIRIKNLVLVWCKSVENQFRINPRLLSVWIRIKFLIKTNANQSEFGSIITAFSILINPNESEVRIIRIKNSAYINPNQILNQIQNKSIRNLNTNESEIKFWIWINANYSRLQSKWIWSKFLNQNQFKWIRIWVALNRIVNLFG